MDLLEKLVIIGNPDVICLQETKASDEVFPIEKIKALGYEYMIFSGQKSYNGVAILSKYPISDVFSLTFYNEDKRHIAGRINDIEVHNFYIPAGGDEPDIEINPKFKHKLEYIKLIQNWFAVNRNKTDKIILVGDLNIAPHEHDVWSSKQLKRVVSHTDIERKMLIDLQNSFDFIDSGRHFTPINEKLYSWWSYRNKDWQKTNRGRRLDHIWVSTPLKSALKSMSSLRDARAWDRPSDHVPFSVEL
jgi:exodeoxyribonuclease-3